MVKKEYIEREAAIKMIRNDLPNVVNYHRMDAIECLEIIPSADVVEVVRCKDCYRRNPNCSKCLRDNLWHDDNDYCSYGIKKAI